MARIGRMNGARTRMLVGGAAVAALLTAFPAFGQSRFISFGDSLTDNGNTFRLTGQPPSPYFAGRFSNGPTWVEQLAGPATGFFQPFTSGNINFAFGGGRSDILGPLNGLTVAPGAALPGVTSPQVNVPPGVPVQIQSYLNRGGTFGPRDIVTMWAGANDILDLLRTTGTAPTNDPTKPGFVLPGAATISATSSTAAVNVAGSVAQLAGAGARSIVVLNLPDLGSAPNFNGSTSTQQAGQLASFTYNGTLATALRSVKGANPGLNLIQVDIGSAFSAVVQAPQAFGFANATQACIQVISCVAGSKDVQNSYVFWDGVHPTESGHTLVARVVDQYLRAPETAGSAEPFGRLAVGERQDTARRGFDRIGALRAGLIDPTGLQLDVIGGQAKDDGSAGQAGYRWNQAGLSIGLVRQIDPVWSIAFNTAFQSGGLQAGVYKGDATSFGGDLVVGYTRGAFFANLGAGASYLRLGSLERNTLGPLRNGTDARGLTYSVLGETGVIQAFGGLTATGKVRLGWIGASMDAFTETGIIAPIAYHQRDVSTGLAGVEVKLAHTMVHGPGRSTTVYGLLGYDRFFGYSGDLTAELANNTALPFVVSGRDPRGPGVTVGLGVVSQFTDVLKLSAEYRGSFADNGTQAHRGTIGLNYKF